MTLTFSIVINTYNRADHLKRALHALRYLRYPAFEVVVVNGPSTDHTLQVLEPYADHIKLGHCPQTNLAQSRNIGIALAAGDIICFIDDDAIPEPTWLNELALLYEADPQVGAVGGFVRDHTGVDYQCRYIVCDRTGDATFTDHPQPEHAHHPPHAPRYPTLIGVNSSFRRQALLDIRGFDEEYAYFLDETDVCVRLIDAGWRIALSPLAEVHHKYAPSHLRCEKRVPKSLYYTCRSKVYFTFRNAIPGTPVPTLFAQAARVRRQLDADIYHYRRFGWVDDTHARTLWSEVRQAQADAIHDAFAYPLGRHLPLAQLQSPPPLHPFPVLRPNNERLRLILISQDYPPRPCGGVGVFIHQLAQSLARRGHEIAVITRAEGRHTVDFEEGVWVHRVPITAHPNRHHPELPDLPASVRDHAYTVYDEARRIQQLRGTTLTLSAIWDLEAAACVASPHFTNFVYLVTTYQLSLPSKPEWQRNPHYLHHHVNKMISGERWIIDHAQGVLASTRAIWDDIRAHNPELQRPAPTAILPFGLPAATTPPPKPADYPPEDTPVILFVGRFEPRKGVDTLLDTLTELLPRHPNVVARLVGDDTLIVDGATLKERFLARHAGAPFLSRIQFLGFVDDAQLEAEYAHCTLFVAPSRYESFGLIYLEAMRWGRPCVGTRVGGIPEVLGEESGLLVPPEDPQALTQALEQLLINPDLRARLGEAGRQRFHAHFTVERFTDRLEALLFEYLQNTSGAQP